MSPFWKLIFLSVIYSRLVYISRHFKHRQLRNRPDHSHISAKRDNCHQDRCDGSKGAWQTVGTCTHVTLPFQKPVTCTAHFLPWPLSALLSTLRHGSNHLYWWRSTRRRCASGGGVGLGKGSGSWRGKSIFSKREMDISSLPCVCHRPGNYVTLQCFHCPWCKNCGLILLRR